MTESDMNPLAALSDSIVQTVERTGQFTVGVGARRRGFATGIAWRPGVIVTADHVIERESPITVLTPDGAQRDRIASWPGTPPAMSQFWRWRTGRFQPVPHSRTIHGQASLFLRSAGPESPGLEYSFGALSSVGGEMRTHGGGKIDRYLRPDVTFYPGFSRSSARLPPEALSSDSTPRGWPMDSR